MYVPRRIWVHKVYFGAMLFKCWKCTKFAAVICCDAPKYFREFLSEIVHKLLHRTCYTLSIFSAIFMQIVFPVRRSAIVNTAGSPFCFFPSTVSDSQWPNVLLSCISGGRKSMLLPFNRLDKRGFPRLRLLSISGKSNNVSGNSPFHNIKYKLFVDGISFSGKSFSRRARPTHTSNDHLCVCIFPAIQRRKLELRDSVFFLWQLSRFSRYTLLPLLAQYLGFRPRPE